MEYRAKRKYIGEVQAELEAPFLSFSPPDQALRPIPRARIGSLKC